MDLKRLRSFAIVANAGSFHHASELLHIAQPALSRQIRDLEGELGAALFVRSARGVKLSPAGEVLLAEVERILPQIDLAKIRTQRVAQGQFGVINIAYTDIAAEMRFSAAAFAEARRTMPDVDFRLSFIASDHQVQALTLGQIDLGVLYRRPPSASELVYRDLRVDSYQLAVSAGHRLARRDSIKLAELRDEDFIFIPKPSRPVTYNEIMNTCLRGGLTPRIALEIDNDAVTLNLVAEGVGVAFANSSRMQRRPMEGVTYVPIEDFYPRLHLAVMWNRDRESPALLRFIDLLVLHATT